MMCPGIKHPNMKPSYPEKLNILCAVDNFYVKMLEIKHVPFYQLLRGKRPVKTKRCE